MKSSKRIITSIVSLVTCFSVCVTTAYANLVEDWAYGYTNSNFSQWLMHFGFDALGFAGDLFVPELPGIGTFLAEKAKDGIDSLADYYAAGYSDDDLYTAYDDAVSSLDNVLISSSDTSMSIPVVTWSTSFPSVSHDLSPAPLSISDRLPSYFSFVSSNAGYSIFFISSPFSKSNSFQATRIHKQETRNKEK